MHAAVRRFVSEQTSSHLASLIDIHLRVWDPLLTQAEPVAIVLAPRVAQSLGATLPTESLAAAGWSFFLGIDLLDNVADRELSPQWDELHGTSAPDLATLAALALIQSLPPMLLSGAGLPGDTQSRLANLFASSCLRMIEGQFRDIQGGAHTATPDLAESMLSLKSGFHTRLFALAGAVAASAQMAVTEDQTAAIERFAVAVGTASELAAELDELFSGTLSRDLLNGKRPWPLLRALERLREKSPADEQRLLALLGEARDSARHGDVLGEIQALLAAGDAPMLTTLRIELWLARARRAIHDAQLAAPKPLEALVERFSPLAQAAAGSRK
ncbi:MAG TPA: hypothetical protein VF815_17875 [Myxococcaceae bacterium]